MTEDRVARIAVGVLSLGCLGVVALVLIRGWMLRPLGDDYCWASTVAGNGTFGAVLYWFQTWTGDVVSIVSNTLFVGVPLAYLPWGLASLVPLAVATGCATGLALVMLHQSSRLSSWRWAVSLAPIIATAWWIYWWLPASFGGTDAFRYPAYYVTFWQNINSGYVIVTALAVGAWVALTSRPFRWGLRRALLVWGSYGFLLGFAGSALAASLAAATLGLVLWRGFRPKGTFRSWAIAPPLVFILTTGAGMLVAISSPGTKARRLVLEQQGTDPSFSRILESVFPGAFSSWWSGVWNLGTAGVAVLGLAVGALTAAAGLVLSARGAALASVRIGLVSALLAVVTGAAEAFAYGGYWHFVPSFTLVWAGVLVAAIAAGATLTERFGSVASWSLGSAGVAVLVVGFFATIDMTRQIENRFDAWNKGPAWIAGVADIYTPEYYTTQCWHRLRTARPLPSRPFEYPYVLPPGT